MRTELEKKLATMMQDLLLVGELNREDDFFELGGTSILSMKLTLQLQEELEEVLHPTAIFEAPSATKLAEYLEVYYPHSVGKLLGAEYQKKISKIETEESIFRVPGTHKRVNLLKVDAFNQLSQSIEAGTRLNDSGEKIDLPVIFILSPPRSGSTLLRVMLSGHPGLFSPNELYLLPYNTLRERDIALTRSGHILLNGGLLTAIMGLKKCSFDHAQKIYSRLVNDDISIKDLYTFLHEWSGGKTIIDKTPYNTLSKAIIARAETYFTNPLYIHLARHPHAMIPSYVKSRIDTLLPFKHEFGQKEIAELVWYVSHSNIMNFLQDIPVSRHSLIKCEDLVKRPEIVMEEICYNIDIDFQESMIRPYKNIEDRMTTGSNTESLMIGDINYNRFNDIDPGIADGWKENFKGDYLGDITWELAELLGYEKALLPRIQDIEHSSASGENNQPVSIEGSVKENDLLYKNKPDRQKEQIESFYLGEHGKRLLCNYHLPLTKIKKTTGILLCYPMGYEYIRWHRYFRRLAFFLSKAGFPVFRFDYFGCGDSEGDSKDWSMKQWMDDVSKAAEKFKTKAELSHLCMVGLRIGASLALMNSSTRDDINHLVLWDPVIDGKNYLDELNAGQKKMINFYHVIPKPDSLHANQTEVLGYHLTDLIFDEINGLEISTVKNIQTEKILIVQNKQYEQNKTLAINLRKEEVQVFIKTLPSPMIMDWIIHHGDAPVPAKTINTIISWIEEVCP